MQVDALAEGGHLAIDLDAAGADPALDIAARGQAHAGEDFLQLFAVGDVFWGVFVFGHLSTSRCGGSE
ncbi:hypothetical protein D3C77_616410 [compost metagenome]